MMEAKKNILIIEVEEANLALADNARFLNLAEDGEEALRRYQVISEVMLAQLIGIKDCHVRFVVTPADGVDAVRFWLLPLLRGEVQVLTSRSHVYQFFPEQHAPSFTIDFALDEGDLSSFDTISRLDMFCLECGARMLNMAFMQCLGGKEVEGKGYLNVLPNKVESLGKVEFPQLATISNNMEWEAALEGPIGGKLTKAYEKHL